MPNCSNCDEMVTPAFARVFADNDGTVHGCVHCRPSAELDGRGVHDAGDRDESGSVVEMSPPGEL